MTALRFEGVGHSYGGRTALRDFSLAVDAGEIVSLLGPSGSGKTTALRIAAGLEAPQSGTVHIGQALVSASGVHTPPEGRDVGLLFQDLALFPHLTVLENVAFGLHTGARERRTKAGELLELVGLAGQGSVYPHQLSGGQQQRVALARALAPSPRILLLDEPFSSLDVVLRHQMRREMLSLLKQLGTSVLFVTHDPEEALYVSDRVAIMRDGTILQMAAPDTLYLAPADRFVASFFGHINVIPGRASDGKAATPFGAVEAKGLSGEVDVLVRAQGLIVSPSGDHAVVRSARILGASMLLELEPAEATGVTGSLTALTAIGAHPPVGARVSLALDPRLSFAFAR